MGGQSAPNLKGKISRVLAAKLSLCCRMDALGDQTEPTLGKEFKEYVENRLATLEEGGMRSLTKGVSKPNQEKFKKKAVETKSGTASYSAEGDVVEEPVPKKKKRKSSAAEEEVAEAEEEVPKKKKKKKVAEEEEVAEEAVEEAPKKKKRKKSE